MSERRGTGPTLLVVEGDEATRAGMKRLLEMSGYYVTAVADEQEAIAIAPGTRPDLILLDANLPPPASLSAAHRIHQHKELRSVPIVVISVHDRQLGPVQQRAEVDDFTVGYITELSRFDQLESLLHHLLLPDPADEAVEAP